MTSAAFKATYSDWKLVRGRKVVQVVLEIPLEAAGDAYTVLGGMPNPASEIWCAVARLNPERKEATPKPAAPARAKRDWRELDPAQQAGILCNEPEFWHFLETKNYIAKDVNTAAIAIRQHCGLTSRADLRNDSTARLIWETLVTDYRVWQQHPELVA